ncbi:MAG: GNAT family N-acetyltransferase [Faecousia sp.]
MNITLVRLTPAHRPQLNDMMEEWLAVEQDFSPCMIRRNDYRDFDSYLENLEIRQEQDGRVPDSTYFCLDLDKNIFVGAVNIRHYLNESLLFSGGHIGDGIRPSQRRKGYATAMLRLALEKCRELGISRVLMTCDKDNIGSAKSIINNGGILENEIVNGEGKLVQRYWIDLDRVPPLTHVYFVRHAQPVHSHREDRTRPLTQEGKQDTALVTQTLADKHINAFYCSPYLRSLDTIQGAAAAYGLPILQDERLRERQAGEQGNAGLRDADSPLRRRWQDFTWHEPGGESIGQVQQRNLAALQEILSENPGKNIAIGTHGTALSSILNFYRPGFGCEDFLRIVDWMPYIVELTFDGQNLLTFRELAHIEKQYRPEGESR